MLRSVIILLCMFNAVALFADEIHLNDGSIKKGAIIQVTPSTVEYDPEGPQLFEVIPRGQIQKIVYANGTVVKLHEITTNVSTKSEKTKEIKKSEKGNTGVKRHDGFYFRIGIGYGFGITDVSNFGGDGLSYVGEAGIFYAEIGYALFDNFILYIARSGISIANPDITYRDKTETSEDSTIVFGNTGIGFTFYLMPYNFFISAAICDVYQVFEGNYVEGNTNSGYGFTVSIGKEWWISANWGLGVSIFSFYANTKAKAESADAEYNIKNRIYGLMFTATYN